MSVKGGIKKVSVVPTGSKIKKVVTLEWTREEEISENEARKIVYNFCHNKPQCPRHIKSSKPLSVQSKEIEKKAVKDVYDDIPEYDGSFKVSPNYFEDDTDEEQMVDFVKEMKFNKDKEKKKDKVVSQTSSKSYTSSSSTSKRTVNKGSGKNNNKQLNRKSNKVKETRTDVKIDKGKETLTKQIVKIPYKLYWKPIKGSDGKDGIVLKIQVQDTEGKKMEIDVSCPNFKPHKVRLNGVKLQEL
uniref:CS domain-containing protein n=1 Tax=Parastrongyloides trichosuri TaxID=131310 RepID=A0A0N5A2P3_PARTI